MTSRSDLLETLHIFKEGHECPYAERVLSTDRLKSIGGAGLATHQLNHYVTELGRLHIDDTCPPTHTSPSSPTYEWAEWVDDTRV